MNNKLCNKCYKLYVNYVIYWLYNMCILFNIYSFYKNSWLVQQSIYFPSSKDTKPGQAQGSVLTNMKMRPELTRAHIVPLDGRCYLFTFSELLPIGSTHHTIISFMLTKNLFQSVCDFSNCTSTVLKRGARERIN